MASIQDVLQNRINKVGYGGSNPITFQTGFDKDKLI